ncbi:23S rRNA pseudouridine(1911/1915/1917) synthase RluD [Arenimonas terrae]|jgi:23S rRNA pseudouridine1911/1915/1917 synthase|uniref:Pseudouridine synthase n=1 Tax=Arenimonas terrae TaxID=2546226 RepID=A0A5C4RW41_9GAMM|nr:23S rRNA pseudouridine(1911/1915/1917) synthase RluD [Arenimonas terrae]TNJ35476.1 23S rRNA pseudouridine(1911/1915/1917) synthase RluD [Arenimonas terrae]
MSQSPIHDADDSERELLEASIPLNAAGRRFDQVLAELFPDFSRSRLTEWIKSGDALLGGRVVKPKEAVRGGEAVALSVKMEIETDAQAEDIPLDILFQDEDVLVVNKPAGLVVHPGAGNPRGTMVNALLHFDPRLAELPRAGIVHRLDKDTSGLMVVARTLRAHTSLVEQLSGREVHRQYLAVVQGTMVAGTTINAPIGRHPTDRVRMAVVKEGGGRDAITHYRVREKFRAHTLVECRLETGRTHQIRVHMAHVRHQIVGDPLYGGAFRLPKAATEELAARLHGFRRQALHAEKLTFRHPATGEPVACEAPLPDDMQGLLLDLRADTAAAKK